jgi:cytochrome c oxidase subunit 2
MAFHVAAVNTDEFESWLKAQASGGAEPALPSLRRGAALFAAAGCGACHAIRGTEARGTLGPDLTHVGSRRYIGGGLLPNNTGALAGWIASSQHLKPGNRMPSFDMLAGEELRLVAEYLSSLR